MVMKTKRIKVSPESILNLREEVIQTYGSCCRSAIFDALSYKTNSEKAKWIRQAAMTKYEGRIINEEKIV